jgi:hypothetical protein
MTTTRTIDAAQAAALENALVAQKDALIRAMNDATDANDVEALKRVAFAIDSAAPVWEAVGYGYKTRELRHRLASAFFSAAEELLARKPSGASRAECSAIAERAETADALAAFYRQ